MQKVLEDIGVNPVRYDLKWASAAEAPRFVKLITDFTAQIKELGPLGQSEGIAADEIKKRIEQALELVNSRKLRVSFGNVTKTLRKDQDYSETHIAELVDLKLSKAIGAGLS